MRHVATRADELGFDSLWAFQRLLHPVDDDWGATYHAVHDPIDRAVVRRRRSPRASGSASPS